MKKIWSAVAVLLFVISSTAQELTMYPTHWFAGMNRDRVQLILKSDDSQFSRSNVRVQYPGVSLLRTHRFSNGKYLVLDLSISKSAQPGNVSIITTTNKQSKTYTWALKKRRDGRGTKFAQGVSAKDLIYLIMPDRFSNGDPSNDQFANMQDNGSDRKDVLRRHGGDLKGIQNHIDYMKELGVTALWMTPVIENNMPLNKETAGMMSGYHGYWFTDHYKVDARLGGNNSYKELSDSLHANGMKLIQDAVYNHIGSHHWMELDPPSPDWVNRWDTYTGSNHRDEALFGRYASEKDKKRMLDGWFVPHLPDVNQRNPFVANFLIQHAIWSTEEFGVDGWRVDTYKYCDEPFLNRINDALLKEYPKLTIFGEAWTNTVTGSAYFTRNNMDVPFKHNAEGVTDFPLNSAIMAALNQPFGWTEGVNKLYMTLEQDILYKEPKNNCIFLDNHDMDRFLSVVNEDMNRYKQGIALLLTLRGIPQLYYGTEILMKNFKNPSDAMVRLDFPGGFEGDAQNKFTVQGRTTAEQQAFDYVKTIAQYRKNSSALTTGKTLQFLPADGLYVYFRYDDQHTVMCVINTSSSVKKLSWADYSERTQGFTKGKDIISGTSIGENFEVAANGTMIIELSK
ncbi:MAG: glycoside hydrolase family 13 protein [Sediminibacterium sp. Gen4]|jgi:neopullulanase|uniref:alpha-amylase family glycosyl hydrolase n=1 Tax=unclassified Sediminibacterium TaxID=2635961 RepID=UPI0015BB59DF|nr:MULTISPECIES: alpha-amylase family glycosyl hydrolase [unclassified Sediminibacterium]MBW0160580.1 glycoside hydrolase family 13 protein [Sediminibacterium sp.]MBW0162869.1 glycoside hydrolase family 13 protein [Sediminibacterium sp.]NWK67160.1 glycoside hydrolase family 13 protein [Sediminibacterium sp. Gen4]